MMLQRNIHTKIGAIANAALRVVRSEGTASTRDETEVARTTAATIVTVTVTMTTTTLTAPMTMIDVRIVVETESEDALLLTVEVHRTTDAAGTIHLGSITKVRLAN